MKTSILPDISSLALPESSRLRSILCILSEASTFSLLVMENLLARCRSPIGRGNEEWTVDWLQAMNDSEGVIEQFLMERLQNPPITRRQLDMARREAESLVERGIWAARWNDTTPGVADGPDCPPVFFGEGTLPSDYPLVGFFNSRKPRALSPHEEWLAAMRMLLPHVVSSGGGIASSAGTLTYDLATAYARQTGCPLLLVMPFSLEHFLREGYPSLPSLPNPSGIVLSPESRNLPRDKPSRLRRRDRMLARLADVHSVLAVTSKGNLFPILEEEHSKRPRCRWILVPERRGIDSEGSRRLLEADPERTLAFSVRIETETRSHLETPPCSPLKIPWKDYLIHYTRACDRAWPGQSHEEYLQNLLRGEMDSGHTALDTLMRIVSEGKIRASKKLVRGSEPVVSWTSRSPEELDSIRQWNPALIRWTFEPYGIAIARRILKQRGAKPAIYGPSSLYSRLAPSDRFRFQLNEPPGCCWKHEREWRSKGDFSLTGIPEGDALILVPGPWEVERIKLRARCPFPVHDVSHTLHNFTKCSGRNESTIN